MMHQSVSFEEYISYLHIDISRAGYAGIKVNELLGLADVECAKLLKSDLSFQDYLGNPILRTQIKKTFFQDSTNSGIIVRSNQAELVRLISQKINLVEIKIPSEITEEKEIILYLQNFESQIAKNFYFIDKLGINFQQLALENIIIISSLDQLYGMNGINIAWVYIKNNDLYKAIIDELSFIGPSSSYYSEIYAIIAVRNHAIIKAQNSKVIEENLKSLDLFFEKYKMIFSYKKYILENYCEIYFKDSAIVQRLMSSKMLLLRKTGDNQILIYYGKKGFINELAILDSLLLAPSI